MSKTKTPRPLTKSERDAYDIFLTLSKVVRDSPEIDDQGRTPYGRAYDTFAKVRRLRKPALEYKRLMERLYSEAMMEEEDSKVRLRIKKIKAQFAREFPTTEWGTFYCTLPDGLNSILYAEL